MCLIYCPAATLAGQLPRTAYACVVDTHVTKKQAESTLRGGKAGGFSTD
jgi:hypothetical protein